MVFYGYFWNEDFWFTNTTRNLSVGWQSFVKHPDTGKYLPSTFDLIWSIPFGIILVAIRRLLQRGLLKRFGYYVGIPRDRYDKIVSSAVLEEAYKTGRKLDKWTLERLSKQTDMAFREIEIWFRKRAKMDVLTDIQRFTESCWHLFVRGSSFIIGICLLWDKSWFWETKYAWIDWPQHYISNDVYYYYVLELSIYWHLTFNLLSDHKKKDFWMMALHHICTIILIYFGWILNFVRIGTLILLVHDASDPWVDLGKILVYSKKNRASEIVFVIFVFVWVSTKDGIYPFRLLYSTTFEAYEYLPVTKYMIVFFNFFLYILMLLHLLWTYNIYEVISNKLRHGELKDVRSDSEQETEHSDETLCDK